MSVPNHNQIDGLHQQHLRPPEVEHQQHQMYPQQDQYYGHYEHHYLQHQGGDNQQWYGPYQDYQQQQQPQQQQQQQYQYRMPQEQYHHHQIYDQQMPMHHHQQPHLQAHQHQVHPPEVEQHKPGTWNEAQNQDEAHHAKDDHAEISDEDSSAIGSSPSKKKSLTVSPTKKLKKKVKVKSATSAGGKTVSKVKMGKILSNKKKDKKLTLTKEELVKYPDESLREVVLKMKNGCDCPENCYKRKIFSFEQTFSLC